MEFWFEQLKQSSELQDLAEKKKKISQTSTAQTLVKKKIRDGIYYPTNFHKMLPTWFQTQKMKKAIQKPGSSRLTSLFLVRKSRLPACS